MPTIRSWCCEFSGREGRDRFCSEGKSGGNGLCVDRCGVARVRGAVGGGASGWYGGRGGV